MHSGQGTSTKGSIFLHTAGECLPQGFTRRAPPNRWACRFVRNAAEGVMEEIGLFQWAGRLQVLHQGSKLSDERQFETPANAPADVR